jgi:putative protease
LLTLYREGQAVTTAKAGERISLQLPERFRSPARGHIEVFKADVAAPDPDGFLGDQISAKKKQLEKENKKIALAAARWRTAGGDAKLHHKSQTMAHRPPGKGGSHRTTARGAPQWWIKTDTLHTLGTKFPITPDRYLLPLNRQLSSQSAKIQSLLGRRYRQVVWVLPPVIMENALGGMKKQLKALIASGFRNYQLGHPSQLGLFGAEKVSLYADYTFNLMNSLAISFCKELNISGLQVSLELDRSSLQELLVGVRKRVPGMPVGLTVYGAPALFTARVNPSFLDYGKTILSPKKEACRVERQEGLTQVFPGKPFSLLPYVDELVEMGFEYLVLDLCGHSNRRMLDELGERIAGKGRYSKLPTFNYLGTLE